MLLSACYQSLARNAAEGELATNCRKFCLLAVALEEACPGEFGVKPKLHLFQELCEMELPTQPAKTWTFRDEEHGGSVVAMGRRLGGANTPHSLGMQTLLKFCARHRVPDMR